MSTMDVTSQEAAAILDPPMTRRQVATLVWLHVIPAISTRQTGRPGHPASVYRLSDIRRAHAQEAARTAKQFTDNDWIGSALLGLELIRVDTAAGEIRWFNGDRAERATAKFYGYVTAGAERTAAHRVIWIAADGEIPPGMQVNHINNLHWDNRRANLELVSVGNNARHAYGKPYLTYHDAVAQLAELPPAPDVLQPPLESLMRAGGAFRHGGTFRHYWH